MSNGIMRSAGGSRSLEGGPGLGVSEQGGTVTYAVTSVVPIAGEVMQTPFLIQGVADPAKSTNHIVIVPVPDEAEFTATDIGEFLRAIPMALTNINLTNASATDVITGGILEFRRRDIFSNKQEKTFRLGTLVNDQRFQTDTIQLPVKGEPFDGYTYIRTLVPGHGAGATATAYNMALTFGPWQDRRGEAVPAGAQAVVSPAQR